jgi:hypothetical protein
VTHTTGGSTYEALDEKAPRRCEGRPQALCELQAAPSIVASKTLG